MTTDYKTQEDITDRCDINDLGFFKNVFFFVLQKDIYDVSDS